MLEDGEGGVTPTKYVGSKADRDPGADPGQNLTGFQYTSTHNFKCLKITRIFTFVRG